MFRTEGYELPNVWYSEKKQTHTNILHHLEISKTIYISRERSKQSHTKDEKSKTALDFTITQLEG